MTNPARKPAEVLIQDEMVRAYEALNLVVILAQAGQYQLARERVDLAGRHATNARKLLAAALKQQFVQGQDRTNQALGYVEDARLFANIAVVVSNNAIRRRKYPGAEAEKIKSSNDAVAYLIAASEVLYRASTGGPAIEGMKKVRSAVDMIKTLIEAATKAGDPNLDDASSADTLIQGIAARTNALGLAAARLEKAKLGG